jgi:glyoxylase-like metal-dependent hydrolase (beta-lactamase superfamily II)
LPGGSPHEPARLPSRGLVPPREPCRRRHAHLGTLHRPRRGRERDLLFDSGFGVVPLRRHVSLLAEREVLCVASHSHFDHVGGHDEFEHRVMHGAEAAIMAAPTRENTLASGYLSYDIFEALPFAGFDPADYNVRPAPATRLVEEGDVIDLGDRVFRVLHYPGHSPGGIGLFEDATGIFFSGDTIYDGKLFADASLNADADYIESMERLKELPVSVCHGGHYASVGRDRMITLADEYIAGHRKPGCPAAH